MSLYWYSLQNLSMGNYTLRFSGTGGVVIRGYAAYGFKQNQEGPNTVIVVEPITSSGKTPLQLYEEAVRQITRLESTTPLPDPQPGEITTTTEVIPTSVVVTYEEAINRAEKLESTPPLPDPEAGVTDSTDDVTALTKLGPTARKGTVLVNANGKTTEEALEEALRQIRKLQLAVGFIGIKGAK